MTPASPAEATVENGGKGGDDAGVPRSKTTPKRVFMAFLPITIFGILIAFDVPLCPSKNLFGLPCPGCGLTRATEAMVTGDFMTMLRMHPLAPIITPVAIFSFARATLISAGLVSSTTKDPLGRIPNAVWVVIGTVLITLWVARMAGFFGGLPDPVDFSQGWIAQGFNYLWDLLPS
ncbi:MAG: DUF2752 domain-containing protein [Sandaracinaceae bacterium]|nr:DUF2752 domain-containing protein [Sandaracinaceae bacterium]